MIVYCTFCDCEAEYMIIHRAGEDNNPHAFRTPACWHCADIYECGQANPSARIIPIGEAELEEKEI